MGGDKTAKVSFNVIVMYALKKHLIVSCVCGD